MFECDRLVLPPVVACAAAVTGVSGTTTDSGVSGYTGVPCTTPGVLGFDRPLGVVSLWWSKCDAAAKRGARIPVGDAYMRGPSPPAPLRKGPGGRAPPWWWW